MSNFCPDCECLENKPLGMAPERPQFQQPTKYDHYGNFQKCKQSKEEEVFLNKKKEELLKLDSKFTNWDFSGVLKKGEVAQVHTQPIGKCRHQLSRSNAVEQGRLNKDRADSDGDSKSLFVLTRTPIQCPISACRRTIGVTCVLSHYLRDHSEDFGVPCQEIYAGKSSIMIFDPSNLNYSENACLGVLAYGGDADLSCSRPSERGICINNAFLPKSFEHLTTHLPILIMACRTSWSALLDNKAKEENMPNPSSMDQELLIIWLASVQTMKPIHGTVTVYDCAMTSSRSAIMQIRDLNDVQMPHEFMSMETNFIRLSHGDINILSQERTAYIHMEIMINEY